MKLTQLMSEIKLAKKKIETQVEFIMRNLARENWRIDPFAKDNTTQEAQVQNALQSITDLEKNMLAYRFAITRANMQETLELEGIKMTIAEWLIWRREIAPLRRQLLRALAQAMANIGSAEKMRATQARQFAGREQEKQDTNYIVNVSDKWLLEETQKLDTIEQRLDGMLSVLNATVEVVL